MMLSDESQLRASGCPDSERLAAYIDGRLAADEAAVVERHVADCPDCYEIVASTMLSDEEVGPASETSRVAGAAARPGQAPEAVAAPSAARVLPMAAAERRSTRSRVWAGAAAALLAAALLLGVRTEPLWWQRYVLRVERPELAELVAAVGAERPIEARLSGGFAYGPVPSPTRGATRPSSPEIRIAAANLERLVTSDSRAGHVAALGVAHLALGEADRAVTLLEGAATKEPGNRLIQNDLAAAYLARLAATGREEDLPKALAAATAASAGATPPLEALFNRALVLERLRPGDEANRAWQDYLARDAASAWATEARRHLTAAR